MKRLLVTGSREWTDRFLLERELCFVYEDWGFALDDPEPVLVHGACPTGADEMARHLWVDVWALPDEAHPPDKSLGKRGFYLRNKAMVDAGADLCLAFFKIGAANKGTQMTVKLAQAAGIPFVEVYG